ncbi:MAG: multicopper oxidase domain-containing protein, partial [Actinomycetota bacterium]|nr:multicopper oxidase domain-containing protein [Actinomycetota bacterium]
MRAAHRTVRAAVAAAAGLTLALSGLTPAAHAATLAADVACTGAPGSATCAFDLYAKASDPIALNASTNVTFWSYALTNGGPAAAVGPTLVVHRGDAVTLTVHNDLPNTTVSERTSLAIPQLNDFPQDFVGIARGDQGTYSFTASRSGTFLYEAGPTEDGPRQVSLGMVGALVVLETGADAGTAYGTPGSAYDDEGVVLLSEVDPRLHASPAGFDMRLFTPQFRLMNGLDHPNVPRIGATPGGRLLLRIVNGGVQQHALGVLGVRQRVIAVSGRPLSNPYDAVSETVAPGDVLDTVIDLPTTQGALYPLF